MLTHNLRCLLASPRGGVAERSRKYCAASAFREDGVVFRSMEQGTPPRGVHKEASRHFLGDAATPPRGDARRGIRSFQNETPNHISLSRPRWTRVSTTSVTLTWTDVPSQGGGREAAGVIACTETCIVSDYPVCGTEVGFAEIS